MTKQHYSGSNLVFAGQRRYAANKAKDIPPRPSKGEDWKMINKMVDIIDHDELISSANDMVKGNFQFFEICEGLLGFYNISSINLYLTWNDEKPLFVDATGLRIKAWRNKRNW